MTRTHQPDLVLRPAAIAELFKPVRLEIYESLQLAGPATIAELAVRLGRAADSLYYHVKKLVSIGVVERRDIDAASGASSPGRPGATYAVVARAVTMRLDPSSRASREAWAGGVGAVLRLAQRDVRAALDSREARTDGPDRNLVARRLKVRLDEHELERVNACLDELEDVLRGHADGEAGEHHAVTIVMAPLEGRKR